MTITSKIKTSKALFSLVSVSMLFFLIKGVSYLLIGSYVPIIFIITILVLVYWSFKQTIKFQNRLLKFWAVLIILWAIARLGVWGIFKIDLNLTESHIREQFGLFQNVISIAMLLIGLAIIKQLKQRKQTAA